MAAGGAKRPSADGVGIGEPFGSSELLPRLDGVRYRGVPGALMRNNGVGFGISSISSLLSDSDDVS